MARIFKNDKCIMKTKKIKVVWICHFSNKKVRNKIRFSPLYFRRFLSLLKKEHWIKRQDFAVWNSNAIREFEKYDDIDLTVIFPYSGIKGKKQTFSINGIKYICFRSEDDYFFPFLRNKLFHTFEKEYVHNRKLISSEISQINPDIVQIIGAENPYYSIAALDISDEIPSIVSLQTLMSDPDYLANFPISQASYEYRSGVERQIIRKSRYIGSKSERFKSLVWSQIKKEAIFLNISIAVGVEIDEEPSDKEYDFVYFAGNIDKACDYAIEAFALAYAKHPDLTLNVSGSYRHDYKAQLDKRLCELGIQRQVFFTGSKATHDKVIAQIKKSRFALLPLKVDLISGTIREAMACGLPVVTTVTPATPNLNVERESVLLSKKGDFQAMADNMLLLLDDEEFATTIRKNAFITVRERYSNERYMQQWRQAYHTIIDNVKNGNPFSEEIV